ncbi:hypothetical protein ACFJIV_03955 [Mucilaginibacter sp. UC70_90]
MWLSPAFHLALVNEFQRLKKRRSGKTKFRMGL